MKLIKLAILSIVVLFLVALGISLLIPSHIRISRAANFPAPAGSVLAPVTDTLQWKNWNPPFMKPDSGLAPGASTRITPLRQTDSLFEVRLSQGARSVVSGWQLYSHSRTDSLTLQWYMDFDLKWYPWEKFSSLFFEATYGNMMEKGLANLGNRQ